MSNESDLSSVKPQGDKRLISLDALRGFDMLWIMGLDEIIPPIARMIPAGSPLARPFRFLAAQMDHADWAGLHFEDLIYPLFIFIVGVSIVFSLSSALSKQSRVRVMTRIISRSFLLYFLGLLASHGFDQPLHGFAGQTRQVHAIRWFGVLQRIAICYGFTACLFCLLRPRYLLLTTVLLLVGYWLMMAYVPVPGVGRGSFVEGKNLANYLDQHYLGGYKYDGDHDPEGYLSNLPAIASCLLGTFAGMLLRNGKSNPYAKAMILLLAGVALAAVGYAWGFLPSPIQFPVIKKIWTSSFVLMAGGYSAIMLGLFYLVIDIWKLRGWAVPFVWIGTNAITLYMLTQVHFTREAAQLLVGGGREKWFGQYQELITMLMCLALTLALARFLYRRGVFIRV